MTNKELHLLRFPANYPIKVVCRQQAGLRPEIDAIVQRHIPQLSAEDIAERPSNAGRFVSISYSLVVSSAGQVEALVQELQSHTAVTMVI